MNNNQLLSYFYDLNERLTDKELEQKYNKKSGALAEYCFHSIFPSFNEQTRNGNFRFDFTSEHTIYEIKNYMYESTGTADEKLLYDAYKYIPALNEKYKNIVIVLCAKMETLYLTKYYPLFQSLDLLDDLINHGVYIILMSDLIHDFYFTHQMTFVKWVGGKTKLLSKIIPKITQSIDSSLMIPIIDSSTNSKQSSTMKIKYVEPFVGGGSVLISILEHYSSNPNIQFVANDLNKQLITTYEMIKNNVELLIESLTVLQKIIDDKLDESLYMSFRETYNEIITSNDEDYLMCLCSDFIGQYSLMKEQDEPSILDIQLVVSSLFIFLNKTCFRGLYRVNKSGEFNVPFGHYKRPTLFDAQYLRRLNVLFQHVEFSNTEYQNILSNLSPNDVAYLDPPYIGTFNDYNSKTFNHRQFFSIITSSLSHIIFSNSVSFIKSYPTITDKYEIETLSITDKINSKSPNSERLEILASKK